MYLLMLVLSIKGQGYAQIAAIPNNQIFEQQVNAQRRFIINLDKGNKLQIELSDINDFDRIPNIDSVIKELMQDTELLKDSLSDELSSKRIDYIADITGVKKIRILLHKPNGSSYLVKQGDVAALKLEQDTINYLGMLPYETNNNHRRNAAVTYYRLSFFLNDIKELPAYLNAGLQDKINNLKQNISSKWTMGKDKQMHLQNDPSVSAKAAKGYVGNDFVALNAFVHIQNYKQYFVPSFSLGAAVTFNNRNSFTREIGFYWEPQFLFAKNSQGNLQTFRNDFLTLSLAQGLLKDKDAKKDANWLTVLSVGYMIKRSGNYYDKNTFRIGAGRLSLLNGQVKLEPVFYFNNFFKGVTPGVRLAVGF